MSSEASVVIKATDQYSSTISKMETANSGFNKSMEETERQAEQYQQRLSYLMDSQSKLQTSLENAKRELGLAKTAFKETGEAADSDKLTAAYDSYNKIKMELSDVTKAAKATKSELNDLNSTSGSGTTTPVSTTASASVVSQMASAGVYSMVGEIAADATSQAVTSLYGDVAGNMVSSVLSSAGMGAAIGTAIAPGVGTAVGAALGGVAGVITAKMDELAAKDDYYKDAVQTTFDAMLETQATSLANGTTLAADRETDKISFTTLMGDGGEDFLQDIVDMSNLTPFLYEDLKGMSKTLLTYGFTGDANLAALTSIGDAGSAVGMSTDDMSNIATAIGRMENTDKTSLEYVNMLTERGLDAIGWLGEAHNMTSAEVYEGISAGSFSGTDSAALFLSKMDELYGGSMAVQSATYSGMSSTLEGMNNELDLAMGEGYNTARKEGMAAEIDWLSGETGEQMKEAYALMGEFEADMENKAEELKRDALNSVMTGTLTGDWSDASDEYKAQMEQLMEDYDTASLEENGAEMGRVLAAAQALAEAEYTNTEGYQQQVDAQMQLIDNVQAAVADAYYLAGYDLGQNLTEGVLAGMQDTSGFTDGTYNVGDTLPDGATIVNWATDSGSTTWILDDGSAITDGVRYGASHAAGLINVPYDNYPALLHQGERVLTAAESRSYDDGGAVSVTISGNNFQVRTDSDIEAIAQALVDKITTAKLAVAR